MVVVHRSRFRDRRQRRVLLFVLGVFGFYPPLLSLFLLLDPFGRDPVSSSPGPFLSAGMEPDREAESAGPDLKGRIRLGLLWLARHQFADGSWGAYYFRQQCTGYCGGTGDRSHDLGVTALAALAFLSSGRVRESHEGIDFETVVRRALDWMAERQDREGCFGPREGKFLYGHALATLAFARAYRVLGDARHPRLIRAGLWFLEAARNPGLAWRYGIRDGENDTSVTGWAGAALLEAQREKIEIPRDALHGIRAWLREVTDERTCRTSYGRRLSGPAAIQGVNDHFQRTEVLTAVGILLRLGTGDRPDAAEIRKGAERLGRDLPVSEDSGCVDFGYWYHGLLAMAHLRGTDPQGWSWWSRRLRRILPSRQCDDRTGCMRGSWDPTDKWGGEGGRVYATALNVMTLSLLEPR